MKTTENKITPFTIIDDLSYKKENLFKKGDEYEKAFDIFLTRRSFSNFSETVFYANEMNMCPLLNKQEVHDFLFHIVPKKKRWKKWDKKESDDKIQLLQEYYNYSRKDAVSVQHFFTDDDMKTIKAKLFKGGLKKKK